ncbi:hypothetical protein BD779DRAFT_1474736 [Infundibulicybe gibba]|nr:hypothetical protein BD779DRAFT_1474736 [Infundibulicybe gibba]
MKLDHALAWAVNDRKRFVIVKGALFISHDLKGYRSHRHNESTLILGSHACSRYLTLTFFAQTSRPTTLANIYGLMALGSASKTRQIPGVRCLLDLKLPPFQLTTSIRNPPYHIDLLQPLPFRAAARLVYPKPHDLPNEFKKFVLGKIQQILYTSNVGSTTTRCHAHFVKAFVRQAQSKPGIRLVWMRGLDCTFGIMEYGTGPTAVIPVLAQNTWLIRINSKQRIRSSGVYCGMVYFFFTTEALLSGSLPILFSNSGPIGSCSSAAYPALAVQDDKGTRKTYHVPNIRWIGAAPGTSPMTNSMRDRSFVK